MLTMLMLIVNVKKCQKAAHAQRAAGTLQNFYEIFFSSDNYAIYANVNYVNANNANYVIANYANGCT